MKFNCYSWYRKQEVIGPAGVPQQEVLHLANDERVFAMDENQILAFQHAQPEDSGKYICVANNSEGTERLEVILNVAWPLGATIQPPHATVDMGARSLLTCMHTMLPKNDATITWLKNGQDIQISGRVSVDAQGKHLIIENFQREDSGMYQCFVRTNDDSAQGTAEIRLGGEFIISLIYIPDRI